MREDGNLYEESIKQIVKILSESEIEKYLPMIREIGLRVSLETAYNVMSDIEVIIQFADVVSNPSSLELRHVHRLLENNIWLLGDHYRYYLSNSPLKKIIKDKAQKKYRNSERKRPDIICKNSFEDYIVIELKRPKHRVDTRDLLQLLNYVKIIETYCPNQRLIEGYLIGAEFDEAVRSDRLRKTDIHLLSYNEILTDLRFRYQRHLKTLRMEV